MHVGFAILALLLTGMAATASGPDLSKLEATFQRIVRASRGEVGVALIHLESGALFEIDGHEQFPMASVCKLPIALELLKQVSEGKLKLDHQISIGASDIRPCCTLSRRHPNGGVTRTLQELLELMIIESDNTAADAVLKLVGGPAAVERRLRALRFHNINLNRIKRQLPAEVNVAHKTGTTNAVINDVGIVTLPADSAIDGHVVLAVFVKNSSRIAVMERSIAQLGAAAYEFFTGRPLPVAIKPRRR